MIEHQPDFFEFLRSLQQQFNKSFCKVLKIDLLILKSAKNGFINTSSYYNERKVFIGLDCTSNCFGFVYYHTKTVKTQQQGVKFVQSLKRY